MKALKNWSSGKKTILAGAIMSITGFVLLVFKISSLGFYIFVVGDVVIVFGVLGCVFDESESPEK